MRWSGLDDVPAIVFSETMRDVDLVVSVAHATGSTPEASHASIEVRRALVREVGRLFAISVEVTGQWVRIHGSRADYSVHLGSGLAHMIPGKALVMTPVHHSNRGRVFLPFVEEDPRAAEIVTKLITLGRDAEITDVGLLRHIEGG